jgi:NAD(P)-dependent dehydrogenase (short-subunit alcohol dehydrogenase family)
MPAHDTQQRTVFITGASTGIGRATAELFLQKGWQVWGSSRKGILPWEHANLHPVLLDLADPGSIQEAARFFLEKGRRLDVLINNGGGGIFAAWEDMSSADIRSQFEILVFGPMELTRLLLPALKESRGCLINVTSLAASFPIPFLATYSAAKAAWSNATQGLQLELKGSGVRIIDLQPGDIRTDFHQSMGKRTLSPEYAEQGERCYQYIEQTMASSPLPHGVADKILDLAGQEKPEPVAAVGSFFQSSLAPFGKRFLPQSLLNLILRRLYRLEG